MDLGRIFWPVVCCVVAISGALEIRSAMGETQTWDEGIHISAGYSYLTLGDYSWNVEHPPLVKIISALPLLRLHLKVPATVVEGKRPDQVHFGIDTLYNNRAPADSILIAARGPNILLTLLFLVAVAWWTRRRFGPAAGLLAVILCAFDPNLIAHGRYVTTDFPITVFYFFSCMLWVEYLEDGGFRRLLLAAFTIALAMVIKFSAVLLIPTLIALYAICWVQRPGSFPLARAAIAAGVVLGAVVLVVTIVYWPETVRCWKTAVTPLATVADRENLTGRILFRLGRWFHLPAHRFLFGLNAVASHNAGGHASYLLGMRSEQGWWYYFPVVFAVKSTMAALAAAALLMALGVWMAAGVWIAAKPISRRVLSTFRAIPPIAIGLFLPPVLYFAISMTGGINIGMRHILPVYPFLYVGAAAALAHFGGRAHWARYGMVALGALQIAECASIAPDYLAFFNALAGGPGKGPEYLVDSNIDWGQDAKKLVHWLDQHGTRRTRVLYFGNAQLRYYGVEELGFPAPLDQQGWDEIDDFAVASVTPLYGVYIPLANLAQLRLRQPIAKIGWSMYVYDLRKPKPAR